MASIVAIGFIRGFMSAWRGMIGNFSGTVERAFIKKRFFS